MSHATRRRTANVPVAAPVAAPVTAAVARPSGRFDALVDMGNPMKGINLFPYLRRRVEGRALGAMGPKTVLELSRTVREAAMPRRWPREVFDVFVCALFEHVFSSLQSRQLQGEWYRTVGSKGDQPGQFNNPRGLALTPDEAFLLVVDGRNDHVAVLRATDDTWVRQLTGPPGTLLNPWRIAVVPSTGAVLVSDVWRHQVVRFRSIDDDTVVGTLGTGEGSGPMQFRLPSGFAVLDGFHRPSVCFLIFSLSFS